MATLYIWEPSREDYSFGHTSLFVHDTNTYISWWPPNNKAELTFTGEQIPITQNLPKTYNEDKDKMKHPANHKIEIERDNIDSNRITQRWKSIINNESYHFWYNNCSTVVMKVLQSGVFCKQFYPERQLTGVFTPAYALDYGKQLQSLKKEERGNCCFDKLDQWIHRKIFKCTCGCLYPGLAHYMLPTGAEQYLKDTELPLVVILIGQLLITPFLIFAVYFAIICFSLFLFLFPLIIVFAFIYEARSCYALLFFQEGYQSHVLYHTARFTFEFYHLSIIYGSLKGTHKK